MSLVSISGGATGTGTFTVLAPSTNTNRTLTLPDATGTVLTSATTTGFPAGSVLQVVQGVFTSFTNISSTAYVDSGVVVSITPTNSSSKILVVASLNATSQAATNNPREFFLNLVRNTTTLMEKQASIYAGTGSNGSTESSIDGSLVFLDSPATTAATTYKVQGRVNNVTSTTMRINQDDVGTSVITLMEIAA